MDKYTVSFNQGFIFYYTTSEPPGNYFEWKEYFTHRMGKREAPAQIFPLQ
jgi:hypothetical protein